MSDKAADLRNELQQVINDRNRALQAVDNNSLEENLAILDGLYGRDNLKYGDSPDVVLAEAKAQIRRDFEGPIAYLRKEIEQARLSVGQPRQENEV